MKKIAIRTLSGIVYIGVILAGLLINDLVFKIFLCLFAALAISELYGLSNHLDRFTPTLLVDILGGFSGIFALYGMAEGSFPGNMWGRIFVLYLIVRLIMQIYSRYNDPLGAIAHSFMSMLYIVFPLGLMSFIYVAPGLGAPMLLAMFIMIWLNDTGAYLVGCALGRHRLFERISPKKSWEGFVGGLVFSLGAGFVMGYSFPQSFEALTLWQMVAMGAVVSVFATWGDLVESLFKRTLHVKDFGNLIPGHGGILDRIDSLLLVSPAMIVYIAILQWINHVVYTGSLF